MNEICVTTTNPDWLGNLGRRLQKPLDRSERLRLGLLCVANAIGCLLVLSPALLSMTASAAALYFGQHLNGPLDWFLFELLGVCALLCGIVAADLLFSRPDFASGVPLTEAQSPELFAMLKRRLSHFRLETVNQVYLDDGTELQIDASPRWLLPFVHRRQLRIGAALLFFLSPAQFRLALAGTVSAHATTRHSMRGSLAQSRRDWNRIATAVNRRSSISSKILRRPLGWIAALVDALGKGLEQHDRQMQYRWLRNNTDERSATELLAARTVAAEFLDKQYWPMILKAADRCPQPVVHPFGHFELLLQRTLQEADVRRWLTNVRTRSADHCDLLAELGIDFLKWAGTPTDSAYNALFAAPAVLDRLDHYWRKQIEPEWNQRHQHFQQKQQRFERLQELATQQALHGRSALRYIKLAADLLDREQAIEAWQSTVAANFSDASVCFACGRSLLAANATDTGREALERAAELSPSLTGGVKKLLREYRVDASTGAQQIAYTSP